MVRIGVSTVAFKKSEEMFEFHQKTRVPFEYSVNLPSEEVERAISMNLPGLSVHVPSPNEGFFPNFASSDPAVLKKSYEILEKSIVTLKRTFSMDSESRGILVLHPGYALNDIVPSLYSERKQFLDGKVARYERFLLERSGIISNAEYVKSDDYRKHFEIFLRNLPKVVEVVKNEGFILAVENLNPRLFYILQTPDEIEEMSDEVKDVNLCLDISHLWVSAQVAEFDYFEGVRRIMETGKVVHIHISNNPSKKGLYEDPHLDLDLGEMDVDSILGCIFEYTMDLNLILEVKKNPLKNLEFLKGIISRYLGELG